MAVVSRNKATLMHRHEADINKIEPLLAVEGLVVVINEYFNFNFILPKVNTDYIRQATVLNIDNLRKIILLMKNLMKTF